MATPRSPRFASYSEGDEPIQGYRLVEYLGKGQFGEVWKGTDASSGIHVAVKIIDLSFSPSALKEVRALNLVKNLNHPNLVRIFTARLLDRHGKEIPLADAPAAKEAGRQLQQLVIVMGLGERSLSARLKDENPDGTPAHDLRGLPADELLGYMEGAARGIDYLNKADHKLGDGDGPIVHCDIKPDNMLIVSGEVQIADCGVATIITSDTRQTKAAGSPAYSPPELTANKPGQGTDQYSLAVSYYELRTGRLPFPDELTALQVMMVHADGRLDFSNHLLSPEERQVLRWATARQPADRYPTCLDFVRQLRKVFDGLIPLDPQRVAATTRPQFPTPTAGSGAVIFGGGSKPGSRPILPPSRGSTPRVGTGPVQTAPVRPAAPPAPAAQHRGTIQLFDASPPSSPDLMLRPAPFPTGLRDTSFQPEVSMPPAAPEGLPVPAHRPPLVRKDGPGRGPLVPADPAGGPPRPVPPSHSDLRDLARTQPQPVLPLPPPATGRGKVGETDVVPDFITSTPHVELPPPPPPAVRKSAPAARPPSHPAAPPPEVPAAEPVPDWYREAERERPKPGSRPSTPGLRETSFEPEPGPAGGWKRPGSGAEVAPGPAAPAGGRRLGLVFGGAGVLGAVGLVGYMGFAALTGPTPTGGTAEVTPSAKPGDGGTLSEAAANEALDRLLGRLSADYDAADAFVRGQPDGPWKATAERWVADERAATAAVNAARVSGTEEALRQAERVAAGRPRTAAWRTFDAWRQDATAVIAGQLAALPKPADPSFDPIGAGVTLREKLRPRTAGAVAAARAFAAAQAGADARWRKWAEDEIAPVARQVAATDAIEQELKKNDPAALAAARRLADGLAPPDFPPDERARWVERVKRAEENLSNKGFEEAWRPLREAAAGGTLAPADLAAALARHPAGDPMRARLAHALVDQARQDADRQRAAARALQSAYPAKDLPDDIKREVAPWWASDVEAEYGPPLRAALDRLAAAGTPAEATVADALTAADRWGNAVAAGRAFDPHWTPDLFTEPARALTETVAPWAAARKGPAGQPGFAELLLKGKPAAPLAMAREYARLAVDRTAAPADVRAVRDAVRDRWKDADALRPVDDALLARLGEAVKQMVEGGVPDRPTIDALCGPDAPRVGWATAALAEAERRPSPPAVAGQPADLGRYRKYVDGVAGQPELLADLCDDASRVPSFVRKVPGRSKRAVEALRAGAGADRLRAELGPAGPRVAGGAANAGRLLAAAARVSDAPADRALAAVTADPAAAGEFVRAVTVEQAKAAKLPKRAEIVFAVRKAEEPTAAAVRSAAFAAAAGPLVDWLVEEANRLAADPAGDDERRKTRLAAIATPVGRLFDRLAPTAGDTPAAGVAAARGKLLAEFGKSLGLPPDREDEAYRRAWADLRAAVPGLEAAKTVTADDYGYAASLGYERLVRDLWGRPPAEVAPVWAAVFTDADAALAKDPGNAPASLAAGLTLLLLDGGSDARRQIQAAAEGLPGGGAAGRYGRLDRDGRRRRIDALLTAGADHAARPQPAVRLFHAQLLFRWTAGPMVAGELDPPVAAARLAKVVERLGKDDPGKHADPAAALLLRGAAREDLAWQTKAEAEDEFRTAVADFEQAVELAREKATAAGTPAARLAALAARSNLGRCQYRAAAFGKPGAFRAADAADTLAAVVRELKAMPADKDADPRPALAEAGCFLALARWEAGQTKEADAAFADVLTVDGDGAAIWRGLALLERGRLAWAATGGADAARLLRGAAKALDQDKVTGRPEFLLALADACDGDRKAAVEKLESLVTDIRRRRPDSGRRGGDDIYQYALAELVDLWQRVPESGFSPAQRKQAAEDLRTAVRDHPWRLTVRERKAVK